MRSRVLGWLSFFFILQISIVTPAWSASPKEALDQIVQSFQDGKTEIGISVRTAPRGKILYQNNGTTPLNPASTMKVITSVASLKYLGANYVYKTLFMTDAQNGAAVQNLFVKGVGDPTLNEERLWRIANELKRQGVKTVQGDLVVDNSLFLPDPALGQGLSRHMMTNAALVLNPTFQGPLTQAYGGDIIPQNDFASGAAMRSEKSASLIKRPKLVLPKTTQALSYRDPARYAGEIFKTILQQSGIQVKGEVRSGNNQGFIVLHEDYSVPLSQILVELNKKSNNFVAEMLLKTLSAEEMGAPGSMQKGATFLSSFLGYNGMPYGEYNIVNGSGLSRENRVSADILTRTLLMAYNDSEIQDTFINSLPIGGIDGTLRRRMHSPHLQGNVHAKTGTLFDTSALSGFMETKSGNTIAFTFLVNVPGAPGKSFPLYEQMLEKMYEEF